MQFVALGMIGTHQLYLRISMNGQLTDKIVRFTARQAEIENAPIVLYVREEDLANLGVLTSVAGIKAHTDVALHTISGLAYRYDAAQQTLSLSIEHALLKPFILDATAMPTVSEAAATSHGWALNYDALLLTSGTTRTAIFNELRYFDSSGVFRTHGTAYSGASVSALGRNRQHPGASSRRRRSGYRRYFFAERVGYMRYDTAWVHSDPATLSVFQIGDAISGSLDWTRSVRLAGLQWRSDFELRPDLVTFPVPQLGGSAVVPSAVSLYVNGVRRYEANVPSGPFVIRQPPSISGAGVATLITRDTLGRDVSTSVPLYIDNRLLRRGLSSYAAEIGVLRRHYGYASFDYDRRPVVSGSLRHGLTDALTLEGHAEAAHGISNMGVGALVGAGRMGVITVSMAASARRHRGIQFGLGYQYISQRVSLSVQTLRGSRQYGDIGVVTDSPVPRGIDRATLSFPLSERQSVAVNYIGFRAAHARASRIAALSYSAYLGRQVSLYASAYQDIDRRHQRAALLNLSIGLGARSTANIAAGTQNGRTSQTTGIAQYAEYDGGWGWAARRSTQDDVGYAEGQVDYLGRYGHAYGWVHNGGGHTQASVSASGSLVLMDGHLAAARRVDNGFALVSTNGVAHVPVLHENRRLGQTDANGYLLVPDLNPYQNNKIGIDPIDLPLDTHVGRSEQNVVPRYRSGVLATFQVSEYLAATVILHDGQKHPLPVGTRVRHMESGKSTVVGYGGMTFIEDLRAVNRLLVSGPGIQCDVTFPYQSDREGLPTLGPLACQTGGATRPTQH